MKLRFHPLSSGLVRALAQRPSRFRTLALLSAAWLLAAGTAAASDGVIEINDARAMAGGITPSDTPGYPVTIDGPGSFILTGSIGSSGNDIDAIEITASDVSIDLNGFTIRCLYIFTPCAGNGTGRGIYGLTASNVTIRNGTVRDMGAQGIYLGGHMVIENVRVLANGLEGLRGTSFSIVRQVVAEGNQTGVRVGDSSIVESSVMAKNLIGVQMGGQGILIRDNAIRDNTTAAISTTIAPVRSGYVGNVITRNAGTTDAVDGNQSIAAIPLGTNFCGIDTTCP